MKQCAGVEISDEVEFIASHISECSEYLDDLDDSVLSDILVSLSLRLLAEDWLCDFIISRCGKSRKSFALFEFVHFSMLSHAGISQFALFAEDFLDRLTASIWRNLSGRLVLPVSTVVSKSAFSRYEIGSFAFAVERPFEGIISHLTRTFGRNVHNLGIVSVMASSTKDDKPENAARNALDLATDSFFYSADSPGQWLCLDFGSLRVTPTHYSLKSNVNGDAGGWRNLLSWVIEGFEDGQSWAMLDKQEDNRELYAKKVTKSWPVSSPRKSRFIRLRQTGKNFGALSDYMIIPAFELFGELHGAAPEGQQ